MQIILAEAAGMCFGVRDALVAIDALDDARQVAIDGQLVHNPLVLDRLAARGFEQLAETDRPSVPAAAQVVVTAHGISRRRRDQLLAAGKTLIDTTCPLVARLQRAVRELARGGALVVIIGRPEHVEVLGLTEDLDSFVVVPSLAGVGRYEAARIGVVAQTTFPSAEAAAIRQQIARANPSARIEWVDTICQPTKDRQQALQDLLARVQAVVVVGGAHSHNTRRLVETCRQRPVAVFAVEGAADVDPAWFAGLTTVGLTAGTSTLPETLQQVHERLLAIAEAS